MPTSEGCTACGRKDGCDHRKAGMFAAIDEALGRLYPTRRWGERDPERELRAGVPAAVAVRLADLAAARLSAMTLLRPGGPDDYSDYVYVLCFGRRPSLLEVREGVAAPDAEADGLEELHLRVALSTLAPFAAVQQVALQLERAGGELVITESPRTGVFDPVLLPRFQKLVAVLAELEVRNLDFGDLTAPPEGFDAGSYPARYGTVPTLANYLFFPQPASTVVTTVISLGRSP